jgi:signal transduction histidine kinase/DNA-binding response OmpR family regulator
LGGSGIFVAVVSTILTFFFLDGGALEIGVLSFLSVLIAVTFYLCNKLRLYKLGTKIMLYSAGYILVPVLYFTCGGVMSAMPIYAAMMVILMFFTIVDEGQRFMIVSIELFILGCCLFVDYKYPHLINRAVSTHSGLVLDNFFAIFIVSIVIGMAVKFQENACEREKRKVEMASKAKSEFLATMSHEIRTPLNAIIGFSEIQMHNELPADTQADIEKIYSSGMNLLGIINDILDISKIETGRLELIPVEYYTPNLINDVIQLNIVRIGSKNITFALDADPGIPSVLFGDELRVRQILNNILSNAFKYTQEGHVALRVLMERKEDEPVLVFAVSDTGIGIRECDIGKLFTKYTQLDTKANRKIEGTGLGLSITKQLVEIMGGTISVESKYRKGSKFTVRIPQKIIDGRPIGESVTEDLQSMRFMEKRLLNHRSRLVREHMPYGKALVVDDVPTNLDVARGLLIPYGLKIDCVSSGREAIELIREKETAYDLIFMDHMMPEMDGIEATEIIREEIGTEYARSVPIVALTANAVSGNEEMFLEHGFNAFISKPIDIMRLDSILKRWVRDKRREGELRSAEQGNKEAEEKNEDSVFEDLRIDGINIENGIARYGSEKSYLEILNSFLKHTGELLVKMENVSRETLQAYAITVHGLKGSCYGICADETGDKARELELAAKAGNFERVSESNAEFIASVNKLLDDLSPLREAGVMKEGKPILPSPDSTLLENILEASRNFDISALEKTMAALERYAYESDSELVAWLREQTDNLEYEAIETRLGARGLI